MAPPNFLAGAAFVKLYWSFNGELAMNVFGALVTGSPVFGQALADSLGAAIKTQTTNFLQSSMAPTTSLVRVGVRDYRTPNQPEYRDTGAPVTGLAVTDALPRGVALCLTLRTGKSGKSFTGRVYLGGFSETHNDAGGQTVAALASQCLLWIQGVDGAMGTAQLPMAVVSRPAERIVLTKVTYHSDGTTTTDVVSDINARAGAVTDVTAYESRTSRWEYQRRRDNGRATGSVSLLTAVARREGA
jgi:hypothetical protein